jgi:hypothetical protein
MPVSDKSAEWGDGDIEDCSLRVIQGSHSDLPPVIVSIKLLLFMRDLNTGTEQIMQRH